jgi:hypothetical protein
MIIRIEILSSHRSKREWSLRVCPLHTDALARISGIFTLEASHLLETLALVEATSRHVPRQHDRPSPPADLREPGLQRSPTYPLPIVLGIDVQPCQILTVDADETNHAFAIAGDILMRAAEVFHLRILLDEYKGSRIAGPAQVIRASTVVNATNGMPVFILVCSNRYHTGTSSDLAMYDLSVCSFSQGAR